MATFTFDVPVTVNDKLTLNGLPIYYGTSNTGAATAAKTVTCNGYALATGSIVFVKFTNTNSAAVASLTMSVNGTTAKNIKRIYHGAVSNLASAAELQKNIPLMFAYNGSYWVLISGAEYNTTYSIITPSAAISIPSGSTTYTMSGITASHVLLTWGFSASSENAPPCSLTWTTAAGSFTITNDSGTSVSETIKPVFIQPSDKTTTVSS